MPTIDPRSFALFNWAWIGLAGVVFVALFFVTAPYGRHLRAGWGPRLPARLGWMLMEAPALLLVALGLALGSRPLDAYSLLLGGLFLAHYVHRAVVFPLRLPGAAQPMPLSIVLSAVVFNLVNGSLQGLWLGELAPASIRLPPGRLALGMVLFGTGAAINLHSDAILRRLRRGATGYGVPEGGLFRLVSCPNYLGEIVEWTGYAVAMAALPGYAFLAWTVANLAPRAIGHHRWYRSTFAGYPRERRALVPFLL
jgi:steroid 5-alpha-reductase/3-oxo-5-alpha-steroid 4-dehydrogenase 1